MQHREWNPKAFFRKVSLEVMKIYADGRGLPQAGDADGAKADRYYEVWKTLPEARRLALETELLPVNDMCSPHARPYLDILAGTVWGAGDERIELSKDWSVNDLAMRLFIDAPTALLDAHQSYAVDMMEHFREYRGRYAHTVTTNAEAKQRMAEAMQTHFRQYVGGARCQVEDFAGTDKFAIFIFHEDALSPVDTFNDQGIVVPVWQRSVVRIAAVYYPETCTLLVKAPRKPEREKLRDLFAEIFVGDAEFFEDLNRNPKYSFLPLENSRFQFPTHPADGIEEVCVTRVVIRPVHSDVNRLSIDLVPKLHLVEVHTVLADHGLTFDSNLIDGIRLQFTFTHGKGRGRFRTISLTNPNSTNLRDTVQDRVIRRYLKEWKIDESRHAFAMAVPAQ
jgi:hypothetical protein